MAQFTFSETPVLSWLQSFKLPVASFWSHESPPFPLQRQGAECIMMHSEVILEASEKPGKGCLQPEITAV